MRVRTPVQIPDIPGYLTLKCDFHIHTVFSDGLVWPTVRSEEGWREGLDAIAITDHIEYLPHKADVSTNHNRSYDLARSAGAPLGMVVVKGSEITRQMPPGHLNAIFLTNSTELAVPDWREAIAAAHRQGAFIFWNHPGWSAQLTNEMVIWYDEHTELLQKGLLQGIEVVNTRDYYPDAHRWALEKGLTMLSNSDIHNPVNLEYLVHEGDHRPMTLVFAKERSAESIREALFARRTAVYSGDRLVGDEEFLRPIFERSLVIKNPRLQIKGAQRVLAQLHNESDLEMQLERVGPGVSEVSVPKELTVPPHRTVLLSVTGKKGTEAWDKTVKVPFVVRNFLVAPDKGLEVELALEISYKPAE